MLRMRARHQTSGVQLFKAHLWSSVSPVHVMFHVRPVVLGGLVSLRGHVDDSSPHLCGLGARALTDRQLPPLGEAEICNLRRQNNNQQL